MKNISFIISVGLIILILFIMILSLLWTPYNVEILAIKERFQMPSLLHWFGTDHLGRDIFSMLMIGMRNSIFFALMSIGIAGCVGIFIGCKAAMHANQCIDDLLMKMMDILFSFPLIIIITLITALRGYHTENIIIGLSLFNIPIFARISRSATLSIRSQQFITAAYAMGKTTKGIIWRHILPNIANILITKGLIQFSMCVLAESGLSYIGLGIQPPSPTLGRMVAEAQTMIHIAPHMLYFPGIAIVFIILSAGLIAQSFTNCLKAKKQTRVL